MSKLKIALPVAAAMLIAGFAMRGSFGAWLKPVADGNVLALSGNIEAHESELGFKSIQSRIVQLPFDEGHWVKQGTVLARADDSEYAQQVAIANANLAVQRQTLESSRETHAAADKTVTAAQADLALREADVRRNEALRQRDFVSAAYIDQIVAAKRESAANLARDRALAEVASRNIAAAEAGVRDAEEGLQLAKIIQGFCTLTAPFDGVVTTRQAELGEVVVPGTPVITVADLDHVWLRAYVNETDISRVRIGQSLTIATDSYPGKVYHGRLSFIAAKAEFTPKTVETHAERVSLVYRIKIDIDNPTHELVPGMPADARLELDATQGAGRK